MSDTKSKPWSQRNWANSVLWFASVITVGILLAQFFREPRTGLSATYRQAPFIIPNKLQNNRVNDSIIAASDKRNRQLLSMLRVRSNDNKQRVLDSIELAMSTPNYLSQRPLESFAPLHNKLCVLHVINEGDKTLNIVQVISSNGIYYEYKDGNGKLQQGESTGKFSIGELAPTESRNVFLWNNGLIDFDGITLVYPDGKIRAEKPVEVTGFTAWLVEHSMESLFVVLGVAPLLILLIISLINVNRKKTAEVAVKDEEDTKSEKAVTEIN